MEHVPVVPALSMERKAVWLLTCIFKYRILNVFLLMYPVCRRSSEPAFFFCFSSVFNLCLAQGSGVKTANIGMLVLLTNITETRQQ